MPSNLPFPIPRRRPLNSQLSPIFRRTPLSPSKPNININLPRSPLRYQSTTTPPPPPSNPSRARIDRLLTRLPIFLQPWTSGLRNAPVSHITSFLLLHELTAVVPLIGLATLFHYTNWLPDPTSAEFREGKWGQAVSQGVERFGRYFGRKGWFGFEREDKSVGKRDMNGGREGLREKEREADIEKRWHVGQKGSKILVEVATAYAITKVLMPLRIVVSVWGTPWFARAVVGRFWGLFGSGKSVSTIAKEVTKKVS